MTVPVPLPVVGKAKIREISKEALSYRGDAFGRVKARNRQCLEEALENGAPPGPAQVERPQDRAR